MTPERRQRRSRYTGFTHKTFYHRYFQGYTEVRVKKPNGKFRIERYYTAPWMRRDLPQGRWAALKLLYAVLALAAIAAVVAAMAMNVLSNYFWFVALPGVITFLCAFVQCAVTISYLAKPRNMTLWEFRSSSLYLRRAAAACAVCACLTALAKLGCIVIYGTAGLAGECVSVVLLLAAALASGGMLLLEKTAKYREIPNDTTKPVNGEEIW